MKNVKLNLPVILEFADYHYIDDFYYEVKQIIPKLKRKEVEFANGIYYGIFYVNADAKYKKLLKEHKKMADKYEDEYQDQ